MKVTFVQADDKSLSVGYLSAYLKKHGHNTHVVFDPRLFGDENVQNPFLRRMFGIKNYLIRETLESKPDLIGFSVNTGSYHWALDMAGELKKYTQIPIIFGGIHPTAVPEGVLKNACLDMVCVGEGEEALLELVENLGNHKCNIPNIWFKKNGRIIRNEVRPLIADLNTLPFPDMDLFYDKNPVYRHDYMLMTSRGCPFGCTFCSNNLLRRLYAGKGKYLRRRNVDNVIEELVIAKKKYNPQRIIFVDEVFTTNIDWLREFVDKYKKQINIPYLCASHFRQLNPEIANGLKRSGCFWVNLGVQSASEKTRSKILKRFETNEEIIKGAQILHQARMSFSIDHIFNIPFETENQQIEALKLYTKVNPTMINTYWLMYFPGMEIIETAISAGMLKYEDIQCINEGKMPASVVVGVGGKESSLKFKRQYHQFAFLFTLFPLLNQKLRQRALVKKWYRFPFTVPLFFVFILKFITKMLTGQGWLYAFIIRSDSFYLRQNLKIKLFSPKIKQPPVVLAKNAKEGEEVVGFHKKRFNKHYASYKKYKLENWRVSYLKRIFKGLEIKSSSINSDDLYLDIGVGGSGYTVIEAAREGCPSVGIDLSHQGILKAASFVKSALGENSIRPFFVNCNAEKLPFKDNAFSKVSSINVLEHIYNDKKVMDEIARVVKPGGKIFISLPNTYKRLPFLYKLFCFYDDRHSGHFRHYRSEEVIVEFEKRGFVFNKVMHLSHNIKLLQAVLCALMPSLSWNRNSGLWWKLEKMDLEKKKDKRSFLFSLIMTKKSG